MHESSQLTLLDIIPLNFSDYLNDQDTLHTLVTAKQFYPKWKFYKLKHFYSAKTAVSFITKINSSDQVSHLIQCKHQQLFHLRFHSDYNEQVEFHPNNKLKVIEFENQFNQPIQSFPSHLISLILGNNYNKPFFPHSLPSTLTQLILGQNIGYFLSYSVFLALNEYGYTNLANYMFYWGLAFIMCTLYLAFYKSEVSNDSANNETLFELYQRIWRILQLKPVQHLVLMLFTCRLAFIAVDTITILKLTEYGFPRETMAMLVFILFPFEMIFPVLITNYSKQQHNNPMNTWILGYPIRMAVNLISLLIVSMFPGSSTIPIWYYIIIILISILGSFSSNIHFVSQCAFFAQISDESIGGTYMTLLNTVANLGSTWPKFIVFYAVDLFTCKKKKMINNDNNDGTTATTSNSCFWLVDGEKDIDGYYIVCTIGFIIGLIWLWVMKHRVINLGKIKKSEWSTH